MHKSIGKEATDTITGFSGLVTGYTEYISGCAQLLLAPKVKKGGEFIEARWFDEQRLVMADENALVLDNARTPGPDRPAPIR